MSAVDILSAVAESVKTKNPDVVARLKDAMVEKELASRVDLLDKMIQKRQAAFVELKKIDRPDVVTFDREGKQTEGGTYTKERTKAIKDATEALDKLDKAIEKAIEGDWSKVKEMAK